MIAGKLNERLPILEVASDCIVSKMGDVTVGLEVEKPEIFTLGVAEYERLHTAFVKALKLLPAGALFHMQDVYRRDRWKKLQENDAHAEGERKNDSSFLARAGDRFFEGRPYLRQECRIFLTLRPAGRRPVNSAGSGLLRSVLVPPDTLDAATIHNFEDCVGQMSRLLSDTGLLRLRRIGTAELVSTASTAGIIEQYCYLSKAGEPPVIRDIDLGQPLRVGEKECVLYTLADAANWPATCAPCVAYEKYSSEKCRLPVGFMAGLGLLLPFDHICNTYIVMEDQAATMNRLEAKRLRLQSLARLSRQNTLSMEATGAFLNEALNEQRQAVKIHANVMLWTDDPAEMKEIRSTVPSAMAAMDAVAHIETVGAPQLWWAGIPGNAGDLPENECFHTFLEQACCFLSYETNYRSSASAFGVRFGDRLTGRPVHVDMDVEARERGWVQNGNLFVLSGSGGGKSFLMNHLCRSYYDQGMHILIVDVGHSYQVLCRLLGGYYFTYEEQNPIRFNPFALAPGEAFDTEKKESLKSLLLALWKKSEEGHRRSEYVALSNAIQAFYDRQQERPGIFPCFDSFYEFMVGEYTGLLQSQNVKEKEFDLHNFLYVVRPYYRGGEFDYLLNAKENLHLLTERFIVFELDNIKDHPILFPIVTLVIMEVFLSKMRRLRGVRKMIVIEEAWKAIANAGMAENIRYWVKTLRKFMGKLALVSQEVEDVISSPIVKQAIINNSDCKILLDQSKFSNRFDEIQALLGLSDKQKAEILSINKGHDAGRIYKDCWIGLGPAHSRVYRLETSMEEYLAYTSDQGEKVKLEEQVAIHGDWQKGIEALAGQMRKGLAIVLLLLLAPAVKAQLPVLDLVDIAAKKVVVAIDLKVQQLQTETIGLQTAEKEVENAMAATDLTDIVGWVQQQEQLYREYYRELWMVKNAIGSYERVADMIAKESRIIARYRQIGAALRQDKHFTPAELGSMSATLAAIVTESTNDLNRIQLVIDAFVTQMSDGGRLQIIDEAGNSLDRNDSDMQSFYQQCSLLSLNRAKDADDMAATRALYGLP